MITWANVAFLIEEFYDNVLYVFLSFTAQKILISLKYRHWLIHTLAVIDADIFIWISYVRGLIFLAGQRIIG